MKTFYYNLQLCRNKSIEIQIEFSWTEYRLANEWFRFNIGTRTRQDHGGFYFDFCFMRIFVVMVTFYDARHWDYTNDCWENYD